MSKILITGASGFIGSFIVEEALRRGYEVWAGIRSTSSREYLQDSRIRFIDLNFGNRERLIGQLHDFRKEFGGWDYVVHNMGATKVAKPADFDRINFHFTQNLVEGLRMAGIQPKKFIYMSSLSVCGPFDEVTMQPIQPDYLPQPNTAYGLSKRKAEQYLETLKDFPYVILRPTGVYGPREKDYFLMIKTIKAGFDFGMGHVPQLLSFIYVKDLARVVFLAIESPVTGRSYFISDGKSYLAKDFRELVQRYLPKKRVIAVTLPLHIVKVVSLCAQQWASLFGNVSTLNADKYKIMKQRNWLCDISSLQSELGFVPEYDLSKGLEESIQWYKQQHWL
jgi:Nucleoside-diphosphate-sugar epimerases